jgi:hypothetical protein
MLTLSGTDYAPNMLTTERQLEVAYHLRFHHINTISPMCY